MPRLPRSAAESAYYAVHLCPLTSTPSTEVAAATDLVISPERSLLAPVTSYDPTNIKTKNNFHRRWERCLCQELTRGHLIVPRAGRLPDLPLRY